MIKYIALVTSTLITNLCFASVDDSYIDLGYKKTKIEDIDSGHTRNPYGMFLDLNLDRNSYIAKIEYESTGAGRSTYEGRVWRFGVEKDFDYGKWSITPSIKYANYGFSGYEYGLGIAYQPISRLELFSKFSHADLPGYGNPKYLTWVRQYEAGAIFEINNDLSVFGSYTHRDEDLFSETNHSFLKIGIRTGF